MKIINDYILKESKLSIAFGIVLFTFIFLIEIIVSMMESILVRGLSIVDVIRMISFYLPMILSQTIPMGIFLGIMITFGNFAKNSEITALNSMGVSLNQILKPVISIGVLATLFIFFLQESLVPRSYIKLQQLSYKMVYENPVFQLKDKVLIDGVSNYKIYIDSVNKRTKDAENVLVMVEEENSKYPTLVLGKTAKVLIDGVSNYKIYIDSVNKRTKDAENVLVMVEEENSKYPTLVLGKTANWEDAALLMKDADFYRYDDKGDLVVTGNFEKKRVPFTSYFKDIRVKVKEIEGMNIAQLINEIKTRDKLEILPYIVEINRKIAVPMSTIALAILGVLLSIGNSRAGKGINFGINIGMILSYRGLVSPVVGVWTPNILLYVYTFIMYSRKVRLV